MRFTPHALTEKTHLAESGHALVSNETGGMQTLKVAEAGSPNRSGARGSFRMVNISKLSFKLRN
jgi:hypothetical protein